MKSVFIHVLLFVFVMLSASCSPPAVVAPKTSDLPTIVESSHVDPKSDNLIALWIPVRADDFAQTKKLKLKPVLVPQPYAMYMFWWDTKQLPKGKPDKVFLFYDNVNKKSYQTCNYGEFLTFLSRVPQDIDILLIDTCTASQTRYMPPKERKRLEDVMQSGNRRWATCKINGRKRMIFCYCEAKGPFLYPGDKR
ncbi:MAG: hypothetical protein K8S55_15340 [Phycisphaerae bacterium]|nr:hypothetical protein [Phycisphaerae bacterium]